MLIELAGGRCTWCGYELARTGARPTRDHLIPRIKGGPTRLENEVASCSSCNRQRGHVAPAAWIEQCRHDRGVEPQLELVLGQLRRLEDAIASEGGMRRIREYLSRERVRVEGLLPR